MKACRLATGLAIERKVEFAIATFPSPQKCSILAKLYSHPLRKFMAVPKKKTSKSKRNSRRATWNRKAAIQAQRALSLGKSVLTNQANSFEYPSDDDEDDDE